jgi:hypothetical protein
VVVGLGLGKVERRVILGCWGRGRSTDSPSVADDIDHEQLLAEHGLVCALSNPCCDVGPYSVGRGGSREASAATKESVRRAFRSLRRKGLITTEYACDGQTRSTFQVATLTDEGERVYDVLAETPEGRLRLDLFRRRSPIGLIEPGG